VLTAELDEPAASGRLMREAGRGTAIVEAKDATPDQLAVREVNTSIYAFDRSALERTLPAMRDDNAQREFYLTDAVRLLVDAGDTVVAVRGGADEALGANTRAEFAEASAIMRERILDDLMASGVTVVDPGSTWVDAGVRIGAETTLLPGTILQGSTTVGEGCEIGPYTRLQHTRVASGATITFSDARGARIGANAKVGPFVQLPEGTKVPPAANVLPAS
jgi:bifunctional UDP-N-acetylglucosamine pyrophosphorylase/glucosamine-1-phosphate N-acetyltransferase